MLTTRRRFLGAILATCVAPAIVRASSLMPLVVRADVAPGLILYADGIHDDTAALQALLDGKQVLNVLGEPMPRFAEPLLRGGMYRITDTLIFRSGVIIGCTFWHEGDGVALDLPSSSEPRLLANTIVRAAEHTLSLALS